MSKPPTQPVRKIRAAAYTRKSTEEGLEQQFNSLDAQREACESYVASQRAEGWILVPDRYDDPGFSGGNLERPALQRLLRDIQAGRINTVVVYRIDRLSRSLMDFAKLIDVFDKNEVTFVSVTQSFNTLTSMGRLTLNILLSFAQFERELIGERIRDKFAASRKKGIWMGGFTPWGYEVKDRKLCIREDEAQMVRHIFERYVSLGSATALVRELVAKNVRNRYGKLIDKNALYKLLNNKVYVGKAVYKGDEYPGDHKAIIENELWDKVHALLKESPRKRALRSRIQSPALLKGLIFTQNGVPMTPSHTRKRGRLYRYYVATDMLRLGAEGATGVKRIPAAEIESAVVNQIKQLVQSPGIVASTWIEARKTIKGLDEETVRQHLAEFTAIWDELFPAEQTRIVQLLVVRVEISSSGAAVTLRASGLVQLIREFRKSSREQAA
jgi:site-specific DNA recombinase